MKTPETSRLFTRWTNPSSGVESLVLTQRVAPAQQTFYFTSPSFTDDGRYLWFDALFPPPGGKHATAVFGVVDLEQDEVRVYHETQHPTGRPAVDLRTGEIYWANHVDIWKRGPLADDKPVRINRFPADLLQGRRLERVATHLMWSADRKSFNLDAQVGHEMIVGDIPLDGSPVRIWERGERFFNHAQFSPTDPNEILLAHDMWAQRGCGPFDGKRLYHRIWTIRRGEHAKPLLREPVTHSGHEWWDADGQHVWYVHYGVGIKKVHVATREETLVWPAHLSHGQTERTSRYIVADTMRDPVVCDCHVLLYDTQTKRTTEIANRDPLAADLTQCTHLHPHPHFCFHDRYICYTTTVHDRVDVALTPVEGLIDR